MAGGFKWTLDWDTNPLKRGGQQAADALENAIDTFGDLAKEADRATEKAGDSLADDVKDGEKTAERALADLEDAFRETARKAQASTRDTGKALGQDVHDGVDRAGEGVQTFKEEAVQNFSEVASSFSGDMSQAADGVQGILGGLASAIPGPVGLISGLLAGIGGAMLAGMQQNTEATKQLVSDMYSDLLENQSSFLSETYLTDAIKTIVDDTKQFEQAQDIAAQSGVALGVVLRGMAGDTDRAAQVTAALNAKTAEAHQRQMDAYASGTYMAGQTVALTDAERDALEAQGNWNDAIGKTNTALDTARQKSEAAQGAISLGNDSISQAVSKTDALSDAVRRMPATGTVRLEVDDTAVRQWASKPVQINAVARVGRPQAN